MNVWCVEASDGVWCAAKDQERKPDASGSVPTSCAMFVVLPWGISKRKPTCVNCLGVLSNSKEVP